FDDAEVVPRVLYALEEVGLQSMQTAYPAELSAGERQRAAIARAIVNRPTVILADEPTGALEQRSAQEILFLLRRIHSEGSGLVVVTSQPAVATALACRALRLEDGHALESTTGELAAGDPRAVRFMPPGA